MGTFQLSVTGQELNGFLTSPENKRNIWRGKFLGNVVTDAQKAAIDSGTFEDLYIGDYWILDNVNSHVNESRVVIADFDTFYHMDYDGENNVYKNINHHILLMLTQRGPIGSPSSWKEFEYIQNLKNYNWNNFVSSSYQYAHYDFNEDLIEFVPFYGVPDLSMIKEKTYVVPNFQTSYNKYFQLPYFKFKKLPILTRNFSETCVYQCLNENVQLTAAEESVVIYPLYPYICIGSPESESNSNGLLSLSPNLSSPLSSTLDDSTPTTSEISEPSETTPE